MSAKTTMINFPEQHLHDLKRASKETHTTMTNLLVEAWTLYKQTHKLDSILEQKVTLEDN
jgi:hypothetical protein